MIRIIIKVEHFGPDGTTLAPTYRTVDVSHERLEKMLIPPGTYAACAIVGCEGLPDTSKVGDT